MANVLWLGTAQAVPRVKSVLINTATVGASYVVTLTTSGKTATYVAVTGDTTATIATGLAAALGATGLREFDELTAAVDATTPAKVLITGPADGLKFDVTSTVTLTTTATVTAGTGPGDAANVANYSTGALPSAADVLVFQSGTVGPRWNLSAITAIALARVVRYVGFTGGWGLPDTSPAGYAEYRPLYLELDATVIELNCDGSEVSQQFRAMAMKATAVTVLVNGVSRSSTSPPAIDVHNLPAASIVRGVGSSISLAVGAAQTATVGTLDFSEGVIDLGAGCTLGDIELNNVTGQIACEFATLAISGEASSITAVGDANCVTGTGIGTAIYSGKRLWQCSGVPGVECLVGAGTLDLTFCPAPTGAFNLRLRSGFTVTDPYSQITRPFDVIFDQCGWSDGTMNLGIGHTATVA